MSTETAMFMPVASLFNGFDGGIASLWQLVAIVLAFYAITLMTRATVAIERVTESLDRIAKEISRLSLAVDQMQDSIAALKTP